MSEEPQSLEIGLVMPIAPIDECSAEHWSEIKAIIIDAVSNMPGYSCSTRIVSEGDSVGLIHKRIVQGLYNSDVVICDVSCKNPNVMFELGMRLAFDKPTVIVKDDKTDYSFDTGGIEHIGYPRDLRFTKIVEFKSQLAKKVKATYEDSLNDPNHSPFLKSFGQFTVAAIDQTSAPADKLMLDILEDLQSEMHAIKRSIKQDARTSTVRYRMKEELQDVVQSAVMETILSGGSTKIGDIIKSVREEFKKLGYTDMPENVIAQTVRQTVEDNKALANRINDI